MAHILLAAYGSRGDILPIPDVGTADADSSAD